MWHGRRAARLGLGDLANFGLGEEHHVEPDLSAGACGAGKRGSQSYDRSSVRVPWDERLDKAQLCGECGRDLGALVTVRCDGPGCTAELRRKVELLEPCTRLAYGR
jgi:hypothetical protein